MKHPNMKHPKWLTVAIVGVVLSIGTAHAFGGIQYIATFNENCMGSYRHSGTPAANPPTDLQCMMAQDPLIQISLLVPRFSLFKNPLSNSFTELITTGDVLIREPDGTFGDLIRFEHIDNLPGGVGKDGKLYANALFFYSYDGDGDKSDVGRHFPDMFLNVTIIDEPKSGDIIPYNPTPKQPGGIASAQSIEYKPYQYIIQSDDPKPDTTPEPSMLPPIVGLIGYAWWRRSKAAGHRKEA